MKNNVYKYKFTVEKHGRKWSQVVIQYNSGRSGKAKVLKERLSGVEEGQTIEHYGRLDVQRNRYGATVELILLSDGEVQDAKEAERQALIDKWWGYFLDSYARGWYYQRAVTELHTLHCHDKDEEIERCKQEIEERKQEEKARRKREREKEKEKRESEYAHFNFAATRGFAGRPKEGEMFVKNNTPYEVISSYYHNQDGYSIGVMSEDWYSVKAKDISDTDRGKEFLADYLENKRRKAERKAAKEEKENAYKELQNALAKVENLYKGEEINMYKIEGTDLFNSFNVYGGGEIIKVSDDKVWLIVNNGSDGGDWSINNIRDGGAGAYGYTVDYETVKDKVTAYKDKAAAYQRLVGEEI